jgi:uncharacterized protein YqgQ
MTPPKHYSELVINFKNFIVKEFFKAEAFSVYLSDRKEPIRKGLSKLLENKIINKEDYKIFNLFVLDEDGRHFFTGKILETILEHIFHSSSDENYAWEYIQNRIATIHQLLEENNGNNK